MKRYETYKDSGIEWLGEIPNHWMEEKLKHIVSCNDDVLDETTDPEEIINYVEISDVDSINGVNNHTQYRFKEAPSRARRITKKGDVIVSTVRTYLKAIAPIKEDNLIVSTGFAVLRPRKIESSFVSYALQNEFFLGEVVSRSTGVSYPAINSTDLVEIKIPVPSADEQRIIASYLDDKVGQIDAVIAEKEKMVEDLQNYRKSVISEAVTRGLNPDVPMKDSGIDWIGMIPEHWIVSKLKAFADVQTGSTPSTSVDKYWENPIEDWYTPSDFEDSDIQLKPSSRKLATIAFKEEACRVFDANTVLIVGIGATLGKVGISSKSCSANQQINAVTFKEKVLPLFGAYYLYSIKDTMKAVANAATLAIMNQSTTKDLPFICPPYEEQRSIVKAIDNKISVTANGVSELQAQIEDLKSYKSSLITEAVTGKIDVR